MTREPATPTGAIGEALRAGIGIGLLEDNLRLNHEQRAL